MEISRALGRGMRASRVFVRSTGAISDCRFVFANSAGNFGIVATDIAKDDSGWRKGITESARALRDDYVTDGIVIVARRAEGDFPSHLEEFPTILSDDATRLLRRHALPGGASLLTKHPDSKLRRRAGIGSADHVASPTLENTAKAQQLRDRPMTFSATPI